MPQDSNFYYAMAAAIMASVTLLAMISLRGWRDWIAFKQAELEHGHTPGPNSVPSAVSRIEVADLKERVKKLEAIAAGIDL
jgi:hypothetical protein